MKTLSSSRQAGQSIYCY